MANTRSEHSASASREWWRQMMGAANGKTGLLPEGKNWDDAIAGVRRFYANSLRRCVCCAAALLESSIWPYSCRFRERFPSGKPSRALEFGGLSGHSTQRAQVHPTAKTQVGEGAVRAVHLTVGEEASQGVRMRMSGGRPNARAASYITQDLDFSDIRKFQAWYSPRNRTHTPAIA